jgi:hypothetical protein
MRTLHRAAEERFGEQIHDVIEDGDYDDGYTLRHLMRLAIVENEMRKQAAGRARQGTKAPELPQRSSQ